MLSQEMIHCETCGRPLQIGDFPFCPHGSGRTSVNGDECDIWQENGFREPQHFTSKRERIRALAAKGLEERVCNAGINDKHVARWVTMDAQTLANAAALVSRPSRASSTSHEPDVPVTWTIRELEP